MHIRGTTPEIRLETVKVRFGSIRCPRPLVQTTLDLVRLLVVLVSPHIVGQGAGKRIVGNPFKTVAKRCVAEDGQGLLQREHVLDYRAKLNPLRGVSPCEMLVSAEHTHWHPMIEIKSTQLTFHAAAV